MRQLLAMILICLSAMVAIGQTNIVDRGTTFEVYTGETFRGSFPKGTAYVDIDANSRLGIRRSANGSQITSFSSTSAYEVNGSSYNSLSALVDALNGAIFLSPCSVVECEIDSFYFCYSMLEDTLFIDLGDSSFNSSFLLSVFNVTDFESYGTIQRSIPTNQRYFLRDTIMGWINDFAYSDTTSRYTFEITENGFCVYTTEQISDVINITFGSNQSLGAVIAEGFCGLPFAEITTNANQTAEDCFNDNTYTTSIIFNCE